MINKIKLFNKKINRLILINRELIKLIKSFKIKKHKLYLKAIVKSQI